MSVILSDVGDVLPPETGARPRIMDAALLENDDDPDMKTEEASVMSGVFGVIYTVSRERSATWRFLSFKILLDLWQLLTLTINTQYGWAINGTQTWWQVLDFIQLTSFMSFRGLSFFLICLYIFVALLMFTLGLCIWVAYSFKKKQFDHVWPITFLRWFGVIFFQMLDIASMTLFLMTLDCQYFGVDPSVLGYNQEFPQQYCWEFPYLIHAAVSALSLAVFAILTVIFQMGEIELNMASKNLLGMAHSKAEVLSFLVKFVMTCGSVFLNSLLWLSPVYLGCSVMLLYLSIRWEPYYYRWVNHARVAVYGALFYSALVLVFLTYAPMVNTNDPATLHSYQVTCTIAMIAGIIPASLLAFGASVLRMRHVDMVVEKFKNARKGTPSYKVHEFSDSRDVEICARCCRKWIDKETLEPEAVQLAYTILKAGMSQLPNDSYMIILYASFLIDVKKGYQTGLAELNVAKKAEKSILERFALFSREQQHTQIQSGAKGGQGADLVSYVEQQRAFRLAMKVNKEAFVATGDFWLSLLSAKVPLTMLCKKVAKLDACVEEATSTYRQLLEVSPDNWMLLRMYATFLEFVKNDPWGASKNYVEAERLMRIEEEGKRNAFLTDTTVGLTNGRGHIAKNADDNTQAVIIMNAKCIIQNVNKVACDLSGYTQEELRGQNVKMLIPRPFSDQHDQYVLNHVQTGKATILDKDTDLVCLHKDRYVFGVTLWVTKLSGFGLDSMFMGMLQALPTPPNSARAWVMGSGVVLSVDATFSDWFGYRPDDLPGAYFSSILKDTKKMDAAFKVALASDSRYSKPANDDGDGEEEDLKPQQRAMSITRVEPKPTKVNEVYIKHKFAGLVKCNVDIMNGGGARAHHFFILTISCEVQESIMVTDDSGKLVHVSKEVAEDLGYSVVDMLGDMAESVWEFILPEPFKQLHQPTVFGDLPKATKPYSCLSGVSVMLMASTDDGLMPKPYKLKVKTSRREKRGGEAANIVYLEKISMDQAKDERCLSVQMDQDGTVCSVGGSPESLFGFLPQNMIGRSISDFLDVFQLPEGQGSNKGATDQHVQQLLVDLCIRALDAPGESFRVGMTAPLTETYENGSLTGAVARHMQAQGTCPAVMQVCVYLSSKPSAASSGTTHQSSRSAALGAIEDGGIQQDLKPKARRMQDASAVPHISDDAIGLQDMRPNSSAAAAMDRVVDFSEIGDQSSETNEIVPSPPATAGDEAFSRASLTALRVQRMSQIAVGQRLVVELNLWRADMLTGVLNVDMEGRVSRYSSLPLCQPGLLLGAADEELVGLDITRLLPAMEGKPIADLFLPDLGITAGGAATVVKKGALKSNEYDRRLEKPGAVNLLRSMHLMDGNLVDLQVQAMPSKRRSREVVLLLHLYKPISVSKQNFRELLKANPVGQERELRLLGAKAARDVGQKQIPIGQHSATSTLPVARVSAVVLRPHSATTAHQDAEKKLSRLAVHTSNNPATTSHLLAYQTMPEIGALPETDSAQRSSQLTSLVDPLVEAALMLGDNKNLADMQQESSDTSLDELSDDLHKMEMSSAFEISKMSEVGREKELMTNSNNCPSAWMMPRAEINRYNNSSALRLENKQMGGMASLIEDGLKDSSNMYYRNGASSYPNNADNDARSVNSADDAAAAAEPVVEEPDTDFRRGRRLKRLSKVLMGDAALRRLKLFKYQAWGAAFLVVAVSLGCFIAMYTLLSSQSTGVSTLNTIGAFGVGIGRIVVQTTALGILFANQGAADLPGLTGPSDLPAALDTLQQYNSAVEDALRSAYFSVMALPDTTLRTIWNTPYLNVSVYQDLTPGSPPVLSYGNYSLWDAGKLFLQQSEYVWQNAYNRNASLTTGQSWTSWSYVLFVLNNLVTLFSGIFTTLDTVVQDVINSAQSVNQVQFLLMAIEGVACCALITVFMYYITAKMTDQRFKLYSVFMVLPATIVRNMASKSNSADALAAPAPEEANQKEADSAPTINLSRAFLNQVAGSRSMWQVLLDLVSRLAFWRARGAVSPTANSIYGPRRQIIKSRLVAVYMCSPFLAWGIMMILIYTMGHSELDQVINPIALFNIVNFAFMRYYRSFSLTMNMTTTVNNDVLKAAQRANIKKLFVFPAEYEVMLYGSTAEPTLTSPHYTLCTEGVTSVGNGPNILYYTTDCLRQNQSTCLTPNSSLYQYTVHGLDRAVQAHIATMNTIIGMNGSNPFMNSSQVYTIWNLRPDIEGGLIDINNDYYNYVLSVYQNVLTTHIIGLVLSIILMLVFCIFMLRPYLREITTETRRIAYLLSQLPPDVDVESLVKRSQLGPGGVMTSDSSVTSSTGGRSGRRSTSSFSSVGFGSEKSFTV
ncbi:hypothetical protein CEUSTIGMA_g6191.t1 [Chlamydomonas eustigma]|uniref:PAS domain-containing protein n=1 Tax=Chlamydomonas eustigma TaxID=1157962 RepID=A0A250X6N6_9CHLO|nr:hypothetical protein CEUSTIGMA_g6191.t1 [Chlamydomonas eustigma]|eukprot:GAX78754.1 hypothetical protein CEUSTIGMA_g6191.t1 [Chlamydomonas eustigma]